MRSRGYNLLFSKFVAWIAVVVVGSYFLFSFDTSVFKAPIGDGEEPVKEYSFIQKIFKAIKTPNINLGIDLQGGAHLVVSVDIEKAIENRLVSESKALDQLFKKQNIKSMPTQQEVQKQVFVMTFEDEDSASAVYRLIKDEVIYLKVSRKINVVKVSLPPQEEQRIRSQVVEQAINVLHRRLDTAGAQGIVIQQHGERQIVVQLPGEENVDEKKELISKTAHLEFKIVEKIAGTRDALLDAFDGDLPADRMIVPGREDGAEEYSLVSAFPDLTGDHITFATEKIDDYGKVKVVFNLDSIGTRGFGELTSNNVGKQLGIIIDDVMYSHANIHEPITSGGCSISGSRTMEEARALAIVLSSGSLQAPLKFEYETRVGSSLGQDQIRKGIISCGVGLGLLLIFSILYYKLAGFFAMMALFFNLFLVMLFLSWFKFALTMPGIAGMVLTIGMAIDASILIYEKIREELATGSTFRKAMEDGFGGAMVVILDSNITTFLTGLVLFKFGSPAIRGFAVTLMAGIIATILAGVFFLRALFEFVLDNTNIKKFGL